MPKRQNPFGDSSPLQFKSHIGKKEVNSGANAEENMRCVYEKTKHLLFEGARKSPHSSPLKPRGPEGDINSNTLSSQHVSGQMTLSSSGKLSAAHPVQQITTEKCMDLGSMLGGGDAPHPLPGQLQIDSTGHLCAGKQVPVPKNVFEGSTDFPKTCQTCSRPSQHGSHACNFCDRQTCARCTRQCCSCQGYFCHLCSNISYDGSMEEVYCLQCT